MHVLSYQSERVRAASSGDCSTEHSQFAAMPLPWKLAFTFRIPETLTNDLLCLHRGVGEDLFVFLSGYIILDPMNDHFTQFVFYVAVECHPLPANLKHT